jgi:protein-tyrosine phosphatase
MAHVADQADSHSSPAAPQRRVPFEGAVNFRDLGGYPTRHGRPVAWGRVYRSDSLADLTDADLNRLHGLRLHTICDFRLDAERLQKPNRLPDHHGIGLYAMPFAPRGVMDMWRRLNKNAITADEVVAALKSHYRLFAMDHAKDFRRVLDRVLADNALPLLIHCASGKDRTGFMAAMLLLTLGVPREAIVRDYVLSDQYRRDLPHLMPPEVDAVTRAAVLQSHPVYLQATFEAIDQELGGEEAFLRDHVGLSQAEHARVLELLLERTQGPG